ncbi:Uncharacterized protein PCOAH_00050710 [Plasmodium coatneyi]|uniref:Transcription elongation factor Spt6 helix-hairpin-helix motif domain-containing protein n=1 Tax=Plasmodium coatneyi TaxID=208452 RepID=A0A1B1E6D4_9APIC|nr:Uncharacterized protein PCOAH_00050710 [Plasmodium coatneyi]ANQ10537.1 Uncharacterized protein PCOAH_00050710 [Plasmodium coatneyi]
MAEDETEPVEDVDPSNLKRKSDGFLFRNFKRLKQKLQGNEGEEEESENEQPGEPQNEQSGESQNEQSDELPEQHADPEENLSHRVHTSKKIKHNKKSKKIIDEDYGSDKEEAEGVGKEGSNEPTGNSRKKPKIVNDHQGKSPAKEATTKKDSVKTKADLKGANLNGNDVEEEVKKSNMGEKEKGGEDVVDAEDDEEENEEVDNEADNEDDNEDDNEADNDDEEEDDDEEDDEEEDEMKGFIVDSEEEDEEEDESDDDEMDDDEEEEEEEDEEGKKKKKKKKKNYDYFENKSLDEEDLELIAENTGMQVVRNEKDTKHRRLKKIKDLQGADDDDDDDGDDDGNLFAITAKSDDKSENKLDRLRDKDYFIDDSETPQKKQKADQKDSLFNYDDNESDDGENAGDDEEEEEEEEEGYPIASDNIYKADSYIHEIISQTFGDVNTVLDIINVSPAKKKKKYDYENDEDDDDEEEDDDYDDHAVGYRGGHGGDDLFSGDMLLDDEEDERSRRIKKKKKKKSVSFFDQINEEMKKKELGEDSDYEVDDDNDDEEGDAEEDEEEEEESDDAEETDEEDGESDDSVDDSADEEDELDSDREIYEREFKQVCDEEYNKFEEYEEYDDFDDFDDLPYYEDTIRKKDKYGGGKSEKVKRKKVLSILDESDKGEDDTDDDNGEENKTAVEENQIDLFGEEDVAEWKKIAEPDERLNQLLTKRDDQIRYSDIPERFYSVYKKRKNKLTKKLLLIESKWIILKLKEKYPNYFTVKNMEKMIEQFYDKTYNHIKVQEFLSDNFLLKKCILTLTLLIKYRNEIPFIFFHKFYLVSPPFNLNILWDIYELDKLWYKTFAKMNRLRSRLKLLSSSYRVHSNVFDILDKNNDLYYEDINIYYFYLKNDLFRGMKMEENAMGEHSSILCITNQGEGNDPIEGDNMTGKNEDLSVTITTVDPGNEKKNIHPEGAGDDLFGEKLLEENSSNKNEAKKKETKKNDESKLYNEKSIPGMLFLEYVRKNKFNIWDDYLLTTEEFYENIAYVYDLIKDETIWPADYPDDEEKHHQYDDYKYGDSKSNRYSKHEADTHHGKTKDNTTEQLTTFTYNCSKIKHMVTNVPEIYGNDVNNPTQMEEWCKSFFPREISNNKEIFKTLICYYAKLLASHPCVKYIFRFFFLKYASLTTVSTSQGEVHIDVSSPDYFSFRLFRFPVHHLLCGEYSKGGSTSFSGSTEVPDNGKPYRTSHDPCYVHNYNVNFFNTELDEGEVSMDLKKRELENYYNKHKYKHIYLEILKNRDNKLVNLIIHPILPNETAYFEKEKSKLSKAESMDNEWINNLLKQLSYAYCYNDLEDTNLFVHVQKKILNNFLCVELLPLFKKNLENMLLASAQNWLMVYIHQSFYLTLNVKPIKIYKNSEEEKAMLRNDRSGREEDNYSSDYKSGDSYTRYDDLESRHLRHGGKKKYYSDESYRSSSDDYGDDGKRTRRIRKEEKKSKKRESKWDESDDITTAEVKETQKGNRKGGTNWDVSADQSADQSGDPNWDLNTEQATKHKSGKRSNKSDLFDSSHSNETDEEYKSDGTMKEKESGYMKHLSYDDNYSDKSGKSYISNKQDEEKKKQQILKSIKKNHNVFEVVSIICEPINYGIRLHIMACDIYGDIIEYIYLDNLYLDIAKKDKMPIEQEKIAKDINIFSNFLRKIKPDVIAIGVRDVYSYLVYSYVLNFFSGGMHNTGEDAHPYGVGSSAHHMSRPHLTGNHGKCVVIPENLYIPSIVTNSLKYSADLTSKYSREALLCLSLCRFVQNPLCVVISLFEEENKNMLNICLHDLQKYICSYKLEALFQRIILDVVNKTGCDINFLKKKKKHLGVMLSYVAGLGLRKREELIKLLHNRNLSTREDLLTLSSNRNLIGKCIYRNCSSFIRIIGHADEYVEALDNTRIHPLNCYDIIQDLFKNVIDTKKNNFLKSTYDIVNYIIDKKKLIKNMEIKEYSRRFYDDKKIYIYPYLKFIQTELLHPYKDYRYNYEKKKEEELFYLIINEKKENLAIGSEVVCKMDFINKNSNYIKITILPYNIRGIITDSKEFLRQLRKYYIERMNLINSNLENINTSHNKGHHHYGNSNNLKDTEYINNSVLGELIKGRISSISYNLYNRFETNFHVVVTDENIRKIKNQTFMHNLKWPLRYDYLSPLVEFDINYDTNTFIQNHFRKLNDNEDFEDVDEEDEEDEGQTDQHTSEQPHQDGHMTNRNSRQQKLKIKIKNKNKYYQNKKLINHPHFKLWNYHEVHAYLKQTNIQIGESIIYPSNELNKLYLHIKTSDDPFIIAKFTVYEKNIQHASNSGSAALHKHLQGIQQVYLINNEQFHSIDQIISHFCDKLKNNLFELYNHPKCKRRKEWEEIRKELSQESLLKPEHIVWALIPPIPFPPKKNANENDNKNPTPDFNPLRFTLMVVPPHNHHQQLYANYNNDLHPKDHIVLQDSIYVDHKSFKLWTRVERNFKNLITWWKEKGYWNRQNERQEYMNEKKRKMEEYRRLRGGRP